MFSQRYNILSFNKRLDCGLVFLCLLSSSYARQTPAEGDALRYLWLTQPPPELISCEIVHERVQAAVQAGQAERDWVRSKNQVPEGAAAHHVGFDHKVQGHSDVVRNKAQQEDHSAAQHHP